MRLAIKPGRLGHVGVPAPRGHRGDQLVLAVNRLAVVEGNQVISLVKDESREFEKRSSLVFDPNLTINIQIVFHKYRIRVRHFDSPYTT